MGRLGIVKKQVPAITLEELKERFPAKKNTITEETVKLINDAMNDPQFSGEEFINTMLDYQNVLATSSASFKEYVNAIKFCAYLESTDFNITEAYKLARASDEFVKERMFAPTDSNEYRELTSRASTHHKSPLVRKILTQSDMPLHLMFQGARYRAVAVLAREMTDAEYSKDRIAAADKLLTHVKPPENQKIELDIGITSEAKSMHEMLNMQLSALATNQKRMLDAGYDLIDVQKLGISLAEPIEEAVIE